MGRPAKPKVKGTRQGRALTPLDKEIIRQTQLLTQNKTETARQLGLSRGTIVNVLEAPAEDKDIEEARKRTTVEMVGRIHGKAAMIMDSITHEDVESGRIPITDKNGDIVGYKHWGPSLMQKVTSGAILVDKMKAIREYEMLMNTDAQSGHLPIPEDLRALESGIKGKLKQLTFLNIQFANDNPELSQQIQDGLAKAEAVASVADAEPAEAEILDFDNPGLDREDT